MFDTHCHLQFSRFKKNREEVIIAAKNAGIMQIVVPGTDVENSRQAVEIAHSHEGIYAAVGIHPHHVYEDVEQRTWNVEQIIDELKPLISDQKVVAVGEVGIDRHVYKETKYKDYHVDEQFIELQKELFERQVLLAVETNKSLIIHNREAKQDLLPILQLLWNKKLEYRSVFHCCEPDMELLDFAQAHHMFLGVDGDVTYNDQKAQFIKKVPLEMLVLETDAPFLLPEPLRTQKRYPNEPKNLLVTAQYIASLKEVSVENIKKQTEENSQTLFQL